ncbi:MAG: type II toxin-antitoxin system HicA family toxin [Nitrospira sp. CG24E]|nr:MAG: type II toxin-antitoxin system HicA family toxin [Nitrospira sp. CG24E]
MPKLRRLAGHDILTILYGFGFQQTSQRGSHVKLVREVAEVRQVLTVPLHTELDPGTLRAIFRQASRFIPEQDLRPHFYT